LHTLFPPPDESFVNNNRSILPPEIEPRKRHEQHDGAALYFFAALSEQPVLNIIKNVSRQSINHTSAFSTTHSWLWSNAMIQSGATGSNWRRKYPAGGGMLLQRKRVHDLKAASVAQKIQEGKSTLPYP
jgi:hypothetical protein